jgi:hypothetical protein
VIAHSVSLCDLRDNSAHSAVKVSKAFNRRDRKARGEVLSRPGYMV